MSTKTKTKNNIESFNDVFDNHFSYEDSELYFMNPNIDYRSEEAYFGENNPLKADLVLYIGRIRKIYDDTLDFVGPEKFKKEIASKLQNECDSLGNAIAKHCNLEKCYVGIFDDLNAFAMPMCWDKNLVSKDEATKKYKYNQDVRVSLEDIVETKNGFKYKDSKGKIFCIGLGLGFFKEKGAYSDGEVAAVILHEMGHSFQQMIVGINVNIANSVVQNYIATTYMLLSIFSAIFSLGFSAIAGIFSMFTTSSLKHADQDELGQQVATQYFGDGDDFNRDKFGDELKETTEKTIKKVSKAKRVKTSILKKIGKFILGIFGGTFMMCYYVISPIATLLSPIQNIHFLSNLSWLRKNRRYEQFADQFAAIYGLGPQLSSALAKMGKAYHQINLYSMNWINYIPVLNLVVNFGHFLEMSTSVLLYGYPSMKKRVVGVYQTLDYELKNNKDLTAQQKKEINDQISDIEKTYNDYVYGKGARNFVYKFCHLIMFKKLQNEKSDIQANVLDVMHELKNEEYFQKKIEDYDKEYEKNAIKDDDDPAKMKKSALDALNKIKSIAKFIPFFGSKLDPSKVAKDVLDIKVSDV